MKVGLRIDVDTWRGTRDGVPQLCRALSKRAIVGTCFFSVGPDNMGRHVWRLLKPRFLIKMLRSNAPGLYGWDILLRGTFWPGPVIATGLSAVLRDAARDGHEIGMHAWDHHAWQARIDGATQATISDWTRRAVEALTEATGSPPNCAATPGWRTTDAVLLSREEFPFRFNSDCRGHSAFVPVVGTAKLTQPQIPNTLPTYDEVIGQNGITNETYNDYLLQQLKPGALNVLTVHAEVEGIACAPLFDRFLDRARAQGVEFVPLGQLLPDPAALPQGRIARESIPGREGWVGTQVA